MAQKDNSFLYRVRNDTECRDNKGGGSGGGSGGSKREELIFMMSKLLCSTKCRMKGRHVRL